LPDVCMCRKLYVSTSALVIGDVSQTFAYGRSRSPYSRQIGRQLLGMGLALALLLRAMRASASTYTNVSATATSNVIRTNYLHLVSSGPRKFHHLMPHYPASPLSERSPPPHLNPISDTLSQKILKIGRVISFRASGAPKP
jgi:hypothetical protein